MLPLHVCIVASIEMDRLFLIHLLVAGLNPLFFAIKMAVRLNELFAAIDFAIFLTTFLVTYYFLNPTWVFYIRNVDNAIRLNDVKEKEILKRVIVPWSFVLVFQIAVFVVFAIMEDPTQSQNKIYTRVNSVCATLTMTLYKSLGMYMFILLSGNKFKYWYSNWMTKFVVISVMIGFTFGIMTAFLKGDTFKIPVV